MPSVSTSTSTLAPIAARPRARKLQPDTPFPAQALTDLAGRHLPIPDPDGRRLVHLQLRRFAGCPVCNLHLRSFVRRHDELVAAGVREVVVFHSTAEELAKYTDGLPFTIVADPTKALYGALGADASWRALLDPRAWPTMLWAIARTLLRVARGRELMPSLDPAGGRWGRPADFLVGPSGHVLACRYGAHADDQWTVDEVLGLARASR